MSYLKLLNARRKSGKQSTMEPVRLSKQQKAWAAQGRCIQCGTQKAGRNCYICEDCQAKDTIENIRDEISALRRRILNRSGGK